MYCSRRRLLRRGLEFHVCTIIKVSIRKSLETYLMILVSFCNSFLCRNKFLYVKKRKLLTRIFFCVTSFLESRSRIISFFWLVLSLLSLSLSLSLSFLFFFDLLQTLGLFYILRNLSCCWSLILFSLILFVNS